MGDNQEQQLINRLIEDGVLSTPRIIEAFKAVPRHIFLTDQFKGDAHVNSPLPIGFGQTISQPLTVAFMLEQLKVEEGDKVLDIGAGSGWTAALFAWLVGNSGYVVAIERIPQLRQRAQENAQNAGYKNIEFHTADGSQGWPDVAPYQKIHVAAAARNGIPSALRDQLAVGGRLVIPVGEEVQDMVVVTREGGDQFAEERHPGFQFVPLIEGPLA